MARRTWCMFSVLSFLFTILSQVDDVFSGTVIPLPWYEDLPAITLDYKVHIDAAKEECFYQYVQPGASFFVSHEVIKGGDLMCGLAVWDPLGRLVHPLEWNQTAQFIDHNATTGGYYGVCIDNQSSRFAEKVVNIFLSVVRHDAWNKYAKEIEQLDMNINNFTSAIEAVERNIHVMQQYQHHSRSYVVRDYFLLMDNNSYVLWRSLIQIFAIAATAVFQVYFVRKLFQVKANSSKSSI